MDSSVSVMKKLLDQGQIAINERNELVELITEVIQDSFMMNCLIAYTGKNLSPSIDIQKIAPPQVLVKNRIDVSVIRDYLLRSKMCLKAHLEESTGAVLKSAEEKKEIEEITQRMSLLVDPTVRMPTIESVPQEKARHPGEESPTPAPSGGTVSFMPEISQIPSVPVEKERRRDPSRRRSSHSQSSRYQAEDDTAERPRKKHSARYKTNFWTGKRELVYN